MGQRNVLRDTSIASREPAVNVCQFFLAYLNKLHELNFMLPHVKVIIV